MSAVPAPRRFTKEEYYELGKLGIPDRRTELVFGEIIDLPPIGPGHSFVSTELRRLLEARLDKALHVRES
jgi:hypothetical protein